MYLEVNGARSYAYTGGKPFNPDQPTVVFIHGVLNDHSVWVLQSRYLAHHGWNVLAVDLPGHCKSQGTAPDSVEAAAGFVVDLLDAAGVDQAALVGHSWGSLIALEAAAHLGSKATHLALVGTAYPMKVSPALIDASLNNPEQALAWVNEWSRSTLAAPPSVLGPGTWVHGTGMALGRRVLRSNPHTNVFHRGFVACDRYTHGQEAIQAVTCPILFLLGQADQMTHPKNALGLVETARRVNQRVRVVYLPVGHHQMSETPDLTLDALQRFLKT